MESATGGRTGHQRDTAGRRDSTRQPDRGEVGMTPRAGPDGNLVRSVDSRQLLGAAVVVVLVALAGVTASAAVVAQDVPQPGEPVNVYGSAEDEANNTMPAGTTVYALVDGDVEDVLTTAEAGQFGGPDAFDDKLAVNSTAGETVRFTINSPDGAMATEGVDLDAAGPVVEQTLDFPNASFAQIDVNGDGNNATDTTGNGRLNDITGDGEFDITDVQTLFDFLDEPVVQDNVVAFDFDGDGRVSIFDVQVLFSSL